MEPEPYTIGKKMCQQRNFVIRKPRGAIMMNEEYKIRRKNKWLPWNEFGNAGRLLRESDTKQRVGYRIKRVGSFRTPK